MPDPGAAPGRGRACAFDSGQYDSSLPRGNPATSATALTGSLAQLVEHRTFNPMVEGSNPSRPTKFNNLQTAFSSSKILREFCGS